MAKAATKTIHFISLSIPISKLIINQNSSNAY